MPLSRLSQQLLRSDSVALWLTGLAFTALHICHQLPIKGFTATSCSLTRMRAIWTGAT
jgi:hypothetical protein